MPTALVPSLVGPNGPPTPSRALPTAEVVLGGPGPAFAADGGFLRAVAYDDVIARYGTRPYELMHEDDACEAALFLLKAGALGDGVQIKPAVTAPEGAEVTDPEMVRRIEVSTDVYEFCQRVLLALGDTINATLWELMDGALAFGSNLAEQVFELVTEGEDRGRLIPVRYQCKPRWAWGYRVSKVMKLEAIRALTDTGWQDVEPEHFTVFSWQPRNGDPRGKSIYRPAYPWFNLKHQILPDYGQFLKKFASAALVIEAGENQPPYTYKDANGLPREMSPQEVNLAAGQKFQNHTVLALPNGAKAQILFSQGTGEAFDRGFDRCDRNTFRTIIRGTRALQEAKHGSKADTESNLDAVFGMAVAQVRGPLGAAFRRQFLYQCVALNYGDRVAKEFTPLVGFGMPDHLQAELLTAFANAWEKGLFEPPQLPWIWSQFRAPVPEGWSPEERQQPGEAPPPAAPADDTTDPNAPAPAADKPPGDGSKNDQGKAAGKTPADDKAA
jgi:hypothetical protein